MKSHEKKYFFFKNNLNGHHTHCKKKINSFVWNSGLNNVDLNRRYFVVEFNYFLQEIILLS